MSVPGDEDDILAQAVAQGLTQQQAAAVGKVSEATVRRRLADPAFRERVRRIRRDMVGRAVNLLANGLADAAAQLHLIATSNEPPVVRLKAAVALLELGLKYQEHADLADEVAELRAEVERIKNGGQGGQA